MYVFFGDGSTNQGTYHETLNLASVWNLPILFILENNKYGMGSAIDRVRAGGEDFYTGVNTYDIYQQHRSMEWMYLRLKKQQK